jgi:Protein of unknown function (DUF3107)
MAVRMRIGIQGARELELEVDDADLVRTGVEAALTAGDAVVWLTDAKGNRFGLLTEKLAFLQFDEGSDKAGVGFGL